MSTPISIVVPVPVKAPRGAVWFGLAVDAMQAFLRASRATRDAQQRAREAADVRALARQLERSSPGMASDLNAAADRHTC